MNNLNFIQNFIINEFLLLKVRIYCIQTYIKWLSGLYSVDKENKSRSHYSINEKENRHSTAIVKIIIVGIKVQHAYYYGFSFNY